MCVGVYGLITSPLLFGLMGVPRGEVRLTGEAGVGISTAEEGVAVGVGSAVVELSGIRVAGVVSGNGIFNLDLRKDLRCLVPIRICLRIASSYPPETSGTTTKTPGGVRVVLGHPLFKNPGPTEALKCCAIFSCLYPSASSRGVPRFAGRAGSAPESIKSCTASVAPPVTA